MSLVPNLVHSLHGNHRVVRLTKRVRPACRLEIAQHEFSPGGLSQPASAELEHGLREVEQRIECNVLAARKHMLCEKARPRPELQDARAGGETTQLICNRCAELRASWSSGLSASG